MNKAEENTILISYFDNDVSNEIGVLKRQIRKRGTFVLETKEGIIEAKINAAGPQHLKDYLDQTYYLAVFIISAYFAGMFGQAGADRYKQISYQIEKFISKSKSKKNVLFIVEVERENNFALKLCFEIDKSQTKEEISQSLNLIPISVNSLRSAILTYEKEKVLLIKYINNNWNIKSPISLNINYGTTTLMANRVLKGFGVCEEKYFPSTKKDNQSEWEYVNELPSFKASINALECVTDYYQRLHSNDDIKLALNYIPVSLSFEMYESFMTAKRGNIEMPQSGEKKITGHCVSVIGYNNDGFIFVNSWGKNWGDGGRGLLPYKYVDKYKIESWAGMTFVKFNKIFTIKRFFKIKLWRNYIQNKKLKGLSRRGQFTDKGNRQIKYEIYACQSLTKSKKGIMVVDIFDPNIKNKKSGWGIFSFNLDNKTIEIEDVYIQEAFWNAGWGSKIISIFENFVSKSGYEKIIGWVNIVDCKYDHLEKRLKYFFEKNNFSISADCSRYPGAFLKVEKNIKGQ